MTQFFRSAVLATLPLLPACSAGNGPPDAAAQFIMCDGGSYPLVPIPPGTCMTGGGGYTVQVLDGGLGDMDCAARCGFGTLGTCDEQINNACEPITVCKTACIGRTPSGLAPSSPRGNVLGRYFAQAAHLEAASVVAFRRLRSELRSLGAPHRLLDACTSAARDEVRHARSAARLAGRFGSTPPSVEVDTAGPRSLMALAIENVREGCIGETFGALMATWQATAACDAQVRRHMQTIVGDETRHAELAWAIDAWLRTQLSATASVHLDAVRLDELARLTVALDVPVDDDLQRVAGVPPPPAARALHRAFASKVARRS